MECLICFEPTTEFYKFNCGSNIAHKICHSCEMTLRLKTKPTRHGRIIKCPNCRKDEHGYGNRTSESYEAELKMLYRALYPRILPFERPVVQFPQYEPRVPARVRVQVVSAPVDPVPAPVPVQVVSAPVPVPAPVPVQVVSAPVDLVPAPAPVPAPVLVPAPVPVQVVSAPMDPVPAPAPMDPVPAPVPVQVPAPSSAPKDWCSNRHIQCPTKNKTTRKCTYPMGCEHKVCRHCNMCASHFVF